MTTNVPALYKHSKRLMKVWFLFWFWCGIRFGLPIIFRNNLYLLSAFNVFVSLVFGSVFLFYFLSRQIFPRPRTPTILFLIFIIINVVASVFSPYVSSRNFYRILGLLAMNFGMILTIWLASRLFRADEYLAHAGKAFIGGFLIALLLLLISNRTGIIAIGNELRFGDETLLHPNTIGVASGIGLLFSLLLPLDISKFWKILVPTVLTIALLSTVSKTSIGGFFLAFGIASMAIHGKDKFRVWALATGIVGIGMLFFGNFLFQRVNEYLQNENIASTFSGRTQIWDFVIRSIPQRPWIGFGYSTFKDAFEPTRLLLYYRVPIVHAHNAFMDVLFSTGILGLTSFVLFLVTVYIVIVKEAIFFSKGKGIAIFALSASIFIATRTFTEAALNLGFDFWILLLTYYAVEIASLDRRRIKTLAKQYSVP